MNSGTHSIAGLLAGVILSAGGHMEPTQTLVLAAAGAFGALLPDIDLPVSTIGRRLRLVSIPFGLIFRHRGFTHSLAALALVTLVAMHYGGLYGVALALGYATHLLADMLTRSGVQLFWPLARPVHALPRRFRLTTGGDAEESIGLALLIALLVVFWFSAPETFRRDFGDFVAHIMDCDSLMPPGSTGVCL